MLITALRRCEPPARELKARSLGITKSDARNAAAVAIQTRGGVEVLAGAAFACPAQFGRGPRA